MSRYIIPVVIILLVSLFLVIATKKRWISWKGGRGIASLTAFHDLQPEDKQRAIEIVIEQKAHKKMEEQETGKEKKEK